MITVTGGYFLSPNKSGSVNQQDETSKADKIDYHLSDLPILNYPSDFSKKNMPTVVFRVDSSNIIGTGHVMRCLTLAEKLKESDASIYFIIRKIEGYMEEYIRQRGFAVFLLPEIHAAELRKKTYSEWLSINWRIDASQTKKKLKELGKIDWFIVDHYSLSKQWELEIRPFVKKIFVIDDLADKQHDCDIFLNQNLYNNKSDGRRYLPPHCVKFIGPKYAILRDEFKKTKKIRDGSVSKIFVFFGGSDPTNETDKVLESIKLLSNDELTFDVVVGASNPNKERIKSRCSSINSVKYYCQVLHIAEIMNKSDLAICAGGSNTWERCILSLPSIIIAVATNQVEIAKSVDALGAGIYLGYHKNVNSSHIFKTIQTLLNSPKKVIDMALACENLKVGTGFELITNALKTI